MTALTSVTAQNTSRVLGAFHLPPEFVVLQINAVLDDIGVDAVKTGMLATAPIIEAVSEAIKNGRLGRLVVDPVLISTGGDALAGPAAVQALQESLFPLAMVVTPNLHEAEVLTGLTIKSPEQVREAARRIHGFGPQAVIVKGGHGNDRLRCVDLLFDGSGFQELTAPRWPTQNTHGSGCTFSAAITAFLACGHSLAEAAQRAKRYVTGAIEASYPLGKGHGPLGHFWETKRRR